MSTAPSPATLANRTVVADLRPEQPATLRPGTRQATETYIHDGVVKAKHLVPGISVRAWLHGEPKGGERVIKAVTPSEDGGTITVEFSTPHPTTDYKAAYRFYVAGLVGMQMTRTVTVPALVAYQEA